MGAKRQEARKRGLVGMGRSGLTLERVCDEGTTMDHDSRVVGVIRGRDGPEGLVYTACAVDPALFAGQVRGKSVDKVAVVRRVDFGRGVVWEHPFPYFDAYEDGHYVRAGDVLVLPSLERGLEGLDVHTGASLWRLQRSGRIDEELMLNDRGEVIAAFSNDTFVRLDPSSGKRLSGGNVDKQDRDPREECMSPLFGGEPDRILVGDKVVELESEGIVIRDVLSTDDEGEYVHRADGNLDSLADSPPRGARVTRETMQVVADGINREIEYASMTIPIPGWEIDGTGACVHGDRLIFPVTKNERDGTTTGLAVYELSTMRQLLLVTLGKPARPRADISGVYCVDGYAVLRTEDSAVFGDAFDPASGIPYYDVHFLVDCERSLSPVVARLASDDCYLSRVFRERKEVWAGLL